MLAPAIFWLLVTIPTLLVNPAEWVLDFTLALPFAVVVGAPWAYAATMVIAVPVYVLGMRRSCLCRWHMLAAGSVAGGIALPAALGVEAWTVMLGVITGALSAGVFWFLLAGRRRRIP
jgi:hypothetical protein